MSGRDFSSEVEPIITNGPECRGKVMERVGLGGEPLVTRLRWCLGSLVLPQ